jgi:hypothetical protein
MGREIFGVVSCQSSYIRFEDANSHQALSVATTRRVGGGGEARREEGRENERGRCFSRASTAGGEGD